MFRVIAGQSKFSDVIFRINGHDDGRNMLNEKGMPIQQDMRCVKGGGE